MAEKRWEDYDTITCLDGTVIDMVKLLDDQERAKVALGHLQPFYNGLIQKLHFVYTFHVKTQATDGYNIFVNPQFTAGLSFEEKVFVMAHEVMHCVLNHLRRSKKLNHPNHKSNVAADYEVNSSLELQDLVSTNTIKHIGALYNSKYDDWGYEKIYDSNPPDPTQGKQQNDSKGGGNGSGNGSGNGNGSGGGSNGPKSPEYIKGWKKAIEDYKKGKLKL